VCLWIYVSAGRVGISLTLTAGSKSAALAACLKLGHSLRLVLGKLLEDRAWYDGDRKIFFCGEISYDDLVLCCIDRLHRTGASLKRPADDLFGSQGSAVRALVA